MHLVLIKSSSIYLMFILVLHLGIVNSGEKSKNLGGSGLLESEPPNQVSMISFCKCLISSST